MSSRRSLRRRVVLAVTVFRRNGEERQLAHTLDITELGMRLGGLTSTVEPGETIEVQRGALKAKFQVIWMGAGFFISWPLALRWLVVSCSVLALLIWPHSLA